MESFLTGLGLSGSAGLNAYLPLWIMAVMNRLDMMELQEPYTTLSSYPVIALLTVLLLIEMTADKIPAVDSVNDMIQTIIRPSAGALLFVASTAGVGNADPTLVTVASLLGGGLSAGSVHATKASVRPGITLSTGGIGNFFMSIFEDIISFCVSIFAILIPFIVIFFSMSLVAILGWWVWDGKRTRKYFPKEKHKPMIQFLQG
jgi:Domain of unknown function (DUF4126)